MMSTRIDRSLGLPAAMALGALLALAFAPAANAQRLFPDDYFFNINNPELDAKHAEMTGQPRPELAVTDWMNGDLSEGDLEGKILVVDLWATWCGPCLAAIPENNELAETYADEGILVIGVCTSSGQEKLAQVVEDREIKYPVAKDPDQETSEAWNVAYYPTYAVVDREGIVRAIGLTPNHIEDVVKAVLEEQPVASAEAASDTSAKD
ncbi:TlpA family protein disulfide reductase [Tautonia plasticadhaerens]|uniref:Thiol-disulfide oxidoreductase ResA n=1 Tax=Tautonia plasticadhaerens TaxID=2527974 RepID=A0A518HE05_9BACT|nr:TlpA disulfide reductase family protein [Tautonia plasticadhaerens]QDV39082.1 Thiol-disulfide oxidoreductase ResA [Tautonia plasticadhaerens]